MKTYEQVLAEPIHLSALSHMGQSPAHCLEAMMRKFDAVHYRIGRHTHHLILGPQKGEKWIVYPKRRQGKDWDVFEAKYEEEGYDIFTESEHRLAMAMARAVKEDPLVAELGLLDGQYEVPVEWTDETGRKCATRGIDILHRTRTVEIKTSQTSNPVKFGYEAKKYAYHAQGSWFHEACKRGLKMTEVKDHFIIVVEKRAPYVVTVMQLTPGMLLEGYMLHRSWMQTLKGCEESNQWPGYSQSVVMLDTNPSPDGADDDEPIVLEDGEEVAA
jgi:hypothetical protein